MKFGRMLGLSLAALLIAAPVVHAQDEDLGELTTKKPRKQTVEEENNDPLRNGPMLGVGGLWALDNFDGIGMNTDSSGGYNINVGYRFNKWVASDMRIERYQEFDAPPGEVNGWAVGLNARGYYPFGAFQPFGMLGMNYLDLETTNNTSPNPKKTDDGPALRFGFGLDWYATPRFVITSDISYMLGLGEVADYDIAVFSLGFLYRP
jgi:opacity protein-like surface antigen